MNSNSQIKPARDQRRSLEFRPGGERRAFWWLAGFIGLMVAASLWLTDLVVQNLESAVRFQTLGGSGADKPPTQTELEAFERAGLKDHMEAAREARDLQLLLIGGSVALAAGLVMNWRRLKRQAAAREAEQRAQTEAILASEERFREMANAITEVFWISNPSLTSVLYVSPAYETMWGRPCQNLYDDPLSFAEAIHPEDRPRVFLELEGLREGREYRSEYRIIRPDGSMRWIADMGFPIRNEAGEVYRSAGIARDITEQKETRRRLELQGRRSALAAEIGITLARSVSRPEMLNTCCSLFTKALGNEAARIWVLNPSERTLELQGESGGVVLENAARLPLNGPGIGEVLRDRQPRFSDCLQETWARDQVPAGSPQITSLAAYPLIAGDIQVGVLALLSSKAMAEDLEGLAAIADHIALGILRKQTNEEREKIFALVENSTDFIAMAGLDGRPSYLNPAGARLIGLPPGAEVSSASISDYLDPESWVEVRDHVLPTTLKTGRWEGDSRLRNLQTGEPIEVHTHSFLVRHPRNGAPLCIATIQRDIRERKQRERELRRVEDERDRFFTLSMDLFCIAGFDGKFRRVNPASERSLGFSAEEFMASPFIEFIHPEDRAATLAEVQKLAEGQILTNFEIRLRCKNGSYRWVSWCATPVVQEGVFFAYGRDLTERKASEEKVRRTEELYRRAIAGAGAVPYSYEYKTQAYLFMGEGIEQLIGYPAREVTPALWQNIIQETVMGGESAGLEKAEAVRRVEAGLIRNWRCDIRVVTRDGQVRWLSDASVQTLDENGKPIGAMGILQDITDRKEVEAALAQSNRLSTLGAEVGIALTRQENLNAMLNRCSEAIVKYAGAAFARIWTLNERESMLELQASAGMYTHVDGEHSRIPIGKFKIGLIAQERVPHLTNFVIGDPRVGNQEWAKREGMVAFAGYPLIVAQRVVGVLGMFARQALSQGVLQELASISDAIALGIVRKQVEDEREKFFALVENNSDFVGMSTLDGQPFYLNPAGARLAGLDDPKKVEGTNLQDYYDATNWSIIHDVALPAMLRDGHWEGELQLKHMKTGELIDVHRRSFVVRRPETGEAMCWATVERDITERKRAEESLRLLSSAIEQSADNVIITGRNGAIKYANPAFLELNGLSRQEVLGKTPRVLKSGKHAAGFYQDLWKTIGSGKSFRAEFTNRKKSGELYFEEKTITPVLDSGGRITHFVATGRDITQRRRAEAEVHALNKQLLDASRQAGMAEVASNVLHNVGNVLNSVNVSTSLLMQTIKGSKVGAVRRVAELLQQNTNRLGVFLSSDDKGRQLPRFLDSLSEHLLKEQEALVRELGLLSSNMEHIKDIIAMQQSYAKVSGVQETVSLAALIDDAVRMNLGAFSRHETQIVREFGEVPPVTTEKHKVLQILVNLMRNAKYALDEGGKKEKVMRLRVEKNGGSLVKISVIDNGIGIAPENLTRIFAHGFTTRKDGHGFGLHSGALAARELGGSLTAQSAGPGQGATFTLELPIGEMKEEHESLTT